MNEENTDAVADIFNNPQGGGMMLLDQRRACGKFAVCSTCVRHLSVHITYNRDF